MRYILLLISAFVFISCSSAQKHDGHDHDKAHMEKDGCGSECSHHSKAAGHDCTACADAGKQGCPACEKKRECCSDKSCNTKDAATCSAADAEAWMLQDNPKIKSQVTRDEFAKIYETNKDKLGQQCANPAMVYCGKTNKDKNINEMELSCLWTKVFRVTREVLPQLDNTPCAKTIKNFAKK